MKPHEVFMKVRPVGTELTQGLGLRLGKSSIELRMSCAGLQGIPGERGGHTTCHEAPEPGDLVPRQREGTPQSAERYRCHRAPRERTIYCALALDPFSRKVVGWALDSSPNAPLVNNALAMAIETRSPEPGTVIHSDHGTAKSIRYGERLAEIGAVPSIGPVGDSYDCR
jgi:transposase InsO family protein